MITMVVLRVSACICSMHVGVTDSIAADVSVWMFVVGCLFGCLLLAVFLDLCCWLSVWMDFIGGCAHVYYWLLWLLVGWFIVARVSLVG